MADNVRRCVDTGVAGPSIEDSTGAAAWPLYELDEAVARMRAAHGLAAEGRFDGSAGNATRAQINGLVG